MFPLLFAVDTPTTVKVGDVALPAITNVGASYFKTEGPTVSNLFTVQRRLPLKDQLMQSHGCFGASHASSKLMF